MATLLERLTALGFTPCNPITGEGDFVLQDDCDGRPAYIREWKSASPCPETGLAKPREPYKTKEA